MRIKEINYAILFSLVLTGCVSDSLVNNKSCKLVCPAGESCFDGECVVSERVCGDALCENTQTCFNEKCMAACVPACGDMETCVDAVCIPNSRICGANICSEEEICDKGVCTNPNVDACNNACSALEACYEGKCVDIDRICNGELCAEGELCQGNVCFNPNVVDECNNMCNAQETCLAGDCVQTSKICGSDVCDDLEKCENGTCVEDLEKKPCEPECLSNETCHLGSCIETARLCGTQVCAAGMVCGKGACVAPERVCGSDVCAEGSVCQNGSCAAIDACGNVCAIDETCYNTHCIKTSDLCDGKLCAANEVCRNSTCVDKCTIVECDASEICMAGVCLAKVNSGLCETTCGADETCYGTECIASNRICNNALCPNGQVCDASGEYCSSICDDGRTPCWGSCCSEGYSCSADKGHCVKDCTSAQTSCMDGWLCCDEGYACEDDTCRISCGNNQVRCGESIFTEICCPAGYACEDNVCKPPCNGTRCGANEELCCNNGTEVCLYQQCLPRGTDCATSNDCEITEFCEESSKTCVDSDADPNACMVKPTPGKFSPLVQWYWPKDHNNGKPVEYADYVRVIVVPLVANLTDDNGDGKINTDDIPDVVFISYSQNVSPDAQAGSVIRVLSGDDGREITSSAPRYWTYPTSLALGDIDNDGITEIIAGTNKLKPDYIEVLQVVPQASSKTGYTLKTKYQIKIADNAKVTFSSIADIDGDGTPEIITNYGVSHVKNGKLEWVSGCNKSIGTVHAADLDGDGKMEIISSTAIYDSNCNLLVDGGSGGQIAIADFMPSAADAAATGELVPEIVHTRNLLRGGQFEFWKIYKKNNVWSWKKVWNAPIPISYKRAKANGYDCNTSTAGQCYSGGGHPVIADFNGDGMADVGVAGRWYYIVYSNDGTPNGGKVLWADGTTQDYSSAVTSSSVFDFEGDGKAEVVYADETKLHIYSGIGSGKDSDGDGYPDPVEIWSTASYNWTGYEYPIVVDCDNDGSTEIIVVSDHGATVGVRAFEDPGGQWVRTRRIWNQHMYHVSNIEENGAIPQHEKPHWLQKRLNSYRQNVQPSGMFNAPNLVAGTLSVSHDDCPYINLTANVSNEGSLGIKAGLGIKFYVQNANGTGKVGYLGESTVEKVLPPGASGTASFKWDGNTVTIAGSQTTLSMPAQIFFVVDEPTSGKTQGEFVECIETDNTSKTTQVKACSGAN